MTNQQAPTYPVAVAATPEQLRHLADSGAQPEGTVIFHLTQQQYQDMPGSGDIRDHITFRRDFPDGLVFTVNRHDVSHQAQDLLDCYNDENPGSPWEEPLPPDALTPNETLKLIRVIAVSLDLDFKVNPGANGTTVTQILRENDLDPASIFHHEENPPA